MLKLLASLLLVLLMATPTLAAVAHRASAAQATTTATTTDTITIPASIQTDDDCFVFISSRGHTSADAFVTVVDTDSGGNTWTKLDNSADRKATFFWKKATSATASKVITVALAITSLSSGISCYSGTASGDPTTDRVMQGNASGSESHPTFTPTNADSMVVFAIYNIANDNAVTVAAAATLGTFEPELIQVISTGGGGSGVWFSAVFSSGGPNATGTFTWSQTNGATKSLTFAIKPPVAASTVPQRTLTGVGT